MSNKPLAFRLGFYISGAVLLVFFIYVFGILEYYISFSKKNDENRAILLSSDIYRNVYDKIIFTQAIASDIARHSEFYHLSGEMNQLLTGILNENEHLQSVEVKLCKTNPVPQDSVFIAYRSGNRIIFDKNGKSDDSCISEDTLAGYLPAMDEPGWSEPFHCAKRNANITIYNYPIRKMNQEGKISTSGYVRCEILLAAFQKLINNTRISESGYAFLVSPKGVYMTYPLEEYVLQLNIKSAYANQFVRDSSKLARFMKAESGPIEVYPPALNRVRSWSVSALIPENNWLLVSTVPFSELHRELFRLTSRLIIIAFLTAAAIFWLVFSIARKVMLPLSMVSKELHGFIHDSPDHTINTLNETRAIRESLVRLQERYEKYRKSEAEANQRSSKFLSDLALASEIQQSIIPPAGNYSLLNGTLSIHTVFRPAHFISGDLYDFFMIDDHKLLIAIGDVSGGGIPAALFMGIAHTYIRSSSASHNAKDVVSKVNKQLCINNSNQFFLTLFLGIIDLQKMTMSYCNAGHTPAFLHPARGSMTELSGQHGLPLGLYPDRDYLDSSITLGHGDSVILYTDGITERINESGEFFGTDSLYSLFHQMKGLNPDEISALIMKSVDDFGGKATLNDDLSLMILKYL